MSQPILEFEGKYRFLSNFYPCFISYENVEYPSVENAYQAAKMYHPGDRVRYQFIKASEAKRLGRVLKMRDNWDNERLEVMYQLVKIKFTNFELLQTKLLQTADAELQEGNWWGDTFWGTVNGVGDNHLGKILMRVRGELAQTKV